MPLFQDIRVLTKTGFYFFFLLSGFNAFGQLGPLNSVRLAQSKIAKGKWQEARSLLNKSIRKDSLQVQARYVYALLFMNPKYGRNNVDSANSYLRAANLFYRQLTSRDRDRIKKFPIDSVILNNLQLKIDSTAFELAKRANSESGYMHFLASYSAAHQKDQAIELRDEAAFVDALKENRYVSFENFLKKYPNSHRSAEAKKRFEKLLFEYSTRGRSLAEYKKFVNDRPTSPHVPEAIENIFLIETECGEPESFEQFIRFYPNRPQSRKASAILFHILPEPPRTGMLNDSLKRIYPLRDWTPFHDKEGWGFLNEAGQPVLTRLGELADLYFCNPLVEDFILTKTNIIGRNGALIDSGNYDQVNDIGGGFLLAKRGTDNYILHKSGLLSAITGCEQAFTINNQFIAVQQKNLWALFSLMGKQLTPFMFEGFERRGQFLIVSRAGKKLLVSLTKLHAFTKGKHEPLVADEIKRYGSKYFWMRNGALEQIIDNELNVVIPYNRHNIVFGALGLVIVSGNQSTLFDWPSLQNLKQFQVAEPWLISRNAGEKPSLHFIPTKHEMEIQADSIWFDQSLAIVKRGDSIRLWVSNDQNISLPVLENYRLRHSKDSVLFVIVSGKNKSTVYEATSFKKVFSTNYQPVPILKNFFLFEVKQKQGLLDDKGVVVLKPEYDAIVFNNGIFSLLKNKQFGSYNPSTKKLIKPAFDANLRSFGTQWTIARKKEKWGFLTSGEKQHTDFIYDDIELWNDSLALIKQNGKQALYSIPRKKMLIDSISNLQKIQKEGDQYLIVRKQNLYGVWNSSGANILPPEFEDVIYLELNNNLIFLGIRIIENDKREVTYFSRDGKILNTFLTDKESAFKLLCD